MESSFEELRWFVVSCLVMHREFCPDLSVFASWSVVHKSELAPRAGLLRHRKLLGYNLVA